MTLTDEYQAVRHHAGLIECAAWGAVEVRGADRVTFLHNLLTQDIKTLGTGACREAALVTPAAKLLADLVVLAGADAHWLLLPRSRIETVLKTLEHYLITEDVALQDRSADHRILALQGPRSREILEGVAASLVLAHSITGSPGFLLVTPVERAAQLREQALRHGRERGVLPVAWETLNVLRLEAGIPWYGVDMDESNLLPETGLEARAVSDTKGCYVGQEVIARLGTHGSVSRKLMGLVCEDTQVPEAGDAVFFKEDEPVGQLTSACFSPALQKPIALGYVKRPSYEAGTAVTVMRGTRTVASHLVKPPFMSG